MYRTHRRNRREGGFGIAPILYLLGLIGVGSGVLFSSYSQGIKNTISLTNGVAVKNDLEAALTTMAATSLISADGTLLCPPQGGGAEGSCAAAFAAANPPPINALIDFYKDGSASLGSLSGDVHLPSGLTTTYGGGSPVEVGVFAAGSGSKQVDPWGHYYVVCRWESAANSTVPAFQIISAGPSGKLDTPCGSSTPAVGNFAASMNAAYATNRASVWQSGTTTVGTSTVADVHFGASGIITDALGNITTTGTIKASAGSFSSLADSGILMVAGSSTLSGAATISGLMTMNGGADVTGGLGADSVTDFGSLGVMGLSTLSGGATIKGTLAAGGTVALGSTSVLSLTDSGAAAFLAGATISGGTLTAETSNLQATTVTSLVDTGTASITGTLTAGTIAATSLTVNGVAITGSGGGCTVACTFDGINDTGALSVSGPTTLASVSASGNINTTGVYEVNGSQIAAANLANGTTGTGALVLANSPALGGTPTAPTAAAGSSSTQIATTAFANPAFSASNTGYAELPSGIFYEWGVMASCGAQNCGVTFPRPFPHAVFVVVATEMNNSASNNCVAIYNQSTTGFAVALCGGNNSYNYFAVGN